MWPELEIFLNFPATVRQLGKFSHGTHIIFFVRDFMKSAMKKVLSKIHGPITDENIKDRGIEVPLTFSIYSVIGFTVSFIIPAVNAQLGLYR
jgi:hypothetical protein